MKTKNLFVFIGVMLFLLEVPLWVLLSPITIIKDMPLLLFAPITGAALILFIKGSEPPIKRK